MSHERRRGEAQLEWDRRQADYKHALHWQEVDRERTSKAVSSVAILSFIIGVMLGVALTLAVMR